MLHDCFLHTSSRAVSCVQAAGLQQLVDYVRKKLYEQHCQVPAEECVRQRSPCGNGEQAMGTCQAPQPAASMHEGVRTWLACQLPAMPFHMLCPRISSFSCFSFSTLRRASAPLACIQLQAEHVPGMLVHQGTLAPMCVLCCWSPAVWVERLQRCAVCCVPLQELRSGIKELLNPEAPAPPAEVTEFVKSKKAEWDLQGPDVVKVRPGGKRRPVEPPMPGRARLLGRRCMWTIP